MKVAEIYTPDPLFLAPEASLEDAMNLMDAHDFRHLPVVSAGRLIGVVSNRDLLEATGWKRNGVWHAGPDGPRTLGEILRSEPVTLSLEDSVVSAALEMSLRRIGCLPVLEGGRLVGIVTETDLIEAYVEQCHGRGGGEDDPKVEQLMTTNAMTVQADSTFEEAVEVCRSTGIRHLPVAEGARVVGMLSDRTLRRAHGARQPGDTPVSRLMASDPVTVAPWQRSSVAAQRMLDHKISALPVVEADRLAGIVTFTDLLDHCLGTLRAN